MVSTFHGLEMAKRALSSQQAALYTTSHNISNANTEGYTRQRVNFEQINTLKSSREPGGVVDTVGSGVQAGSIQRIRDQFLDVQYRKEHGKVGYFIERANAMKQMEAIMNEPSELGLSYVMNKFWDSLQDLSVNPEDSGARSVVAQRAEAIVDTFNYISQSLEAVRNDLKNQLDVNQTEFNSLLDQINSVNQEIGEIEPHGHVPNDLYDERDRLIDRLSEMADISVSYEKSSGMPSSIAEGKATITLNGTGGQPITLVDGNSYERKHLFVAYDDNNNVEDFHFYNPELVPDGTTEITPDILVDATVVAANDFKSVGTMRGLMEMNGYIGTGEEPQGYYNKVLSDLDKMALEFVTEFNRIHAEGHDLEGNTGTDVADFFVFDNEEGRSALTISVNEEILTNRNLIAASGNGDSGDGGNAANLTAAYTNHLSSLGTKTSVKSFYEGVIGEIGVVSQESYRMVDNSQVLRQQVERNRDSVSAVSLDEEMANMIKFQHAYNAAARSMTTVDEMLDRIINGMGLVGR
ncbi:flagellar hook-associated protein 1 FlgK [Amphibacillus marinus]|uniref:Flagellar hook-associated protein 1 n=1 Tax=Amphibacillus marinus TaxID=872970 RepID=A0A1H8QZ10_9BACI|nr:flagellar hook-associated protein FlgK [Amphibacillus marinus]SEO59108.1 flagellar hook-associated protein 1 FlgK [Amphibacillus marinus]